MAGFGRIFFGAPWGRFYEMSFSTLPGEVLPGEVFPREAFPREVLPEFLGAS
jgi:hypothetical protein